MAITFRSMDISQHDVREVEIGVELNSAQAELKGSVMELTVVFSLNEMHPAKIGEEAGVLGLKSVSALKVLEGFRDVGEFEIGHTIEKENLSERGVVFRFGERDLRLVGWGVDPNVVCER